MKIFLVGGAVRDELMGLDITDRDFVVTGSTVNEMLALGFSQVGKDFPVFLHPQTNEEYALARKERKTAPGHDGFHFDFSPKTTLEDDLIRRDLTINAIAKDEHGHYIDPYGGRMDIQKKCLRHVSPAFREDPLRVLRVCRFQAKFPDFIIADDTLNIMREMIHDTDFKTLSHHRLWQELYKALNYQNPHIFFKVLFDLHWIPQPIFQAINIYQFKKETHSLSKLALMITNQEALNWIHHAFHLPNDFLLIIEQTLKHHALLSGKYDSQSILTLLQDLKAFSDPKWICVFGEIAVYKNQPNLQAILESALRAAKTISAKNFPQTSPGPLLGQKIKMARIQAIDTLL